MTERNLGLKREIASYFFKMFHYVILLIHTAFSYSQLKVKS